jgi:hypothetical protein
VLQQQTIEDVDALIIADAEETDALAESTTAHPDGLDFDVDRRMR